MKILPTNVTWKRPIWSQTTKNGNTALLWTSETEKLGKSQYWHRPNAHAETLYWVDLLFASGKKEQNSHIVNILALLSTICLFDLWPQYLPDHQVQTEYNRSFGVCHHTRLKKALQVTHFWQPKSRACKSISNEFFEHMFIACYSEISRFTYKVFQTALIWFRIFSWLYLRI